MPRRGPNDIPRGDRQLTIGGGGGARSGAGRIAGVGAAPRVSPSSLRSFGVRAEGSWGLRLLANSFGNLAQAADHVVDTEFKIRAKAVEREQSLLGTEAGIGTELDQLVLPAGDSIGDEAFRRSAVLAAHANMDTETYESAEVFGKKFAGQPEAFKKAFNENARARAAKVAPELRADLLQSYTRLGMRKYLELDQERREFTRDQNRADILKATEKYGTTAGQQARAGDWHGAQAELDQLGKMTTAAGPVELGGSGAYSLQEIEGARQKANKDIRQNFLLGWVERSQNPSEVLRGLRTGQTGNPDLDAVIASTDQKQISSLAHSMEVDIRQQASAARMEARQAATLARVEQKVRLDTAKSAVSEASYVLAQGKLPPNLKDVAAMASEFPDLAGKLSIGLRQQEAASQFVTLPAQQREEILNEMAADPVATKEQVDLTKALRARHNEIVGSDDPYTEGVNAGIIPPTPLDLNDPATIATRMATAEQQEQYWPESKPSGFSKTETAALVDGLAGMTSAEKAATMGSLSNTMGDRFSRLLPKIADKEPVTAMAANLATSNPNLAADIFRGQDLIKTGTVKADSADKYAAAFDARVGTALQHAGKNAGDLRDTAIALLAARRFSAGKTEAPDVSYGDDQSEFQAAVEEAANAKIFDYNDQTIVGPDAETDEDTFANILDNVDDEDLAVATDDGRLLPPVMASGAPLTAEAFKKYGKLEPVGPGRYMVNIGGNGHALDPRTNEPYVFDWSGNTAGARRRAAEASQAGREGILAPMLGGGGAAPAPAKAGSWMDYLISPAEGAELPAGVGSVDVRIGGQDLKVNPSVAVFLQRMLGITMGAPSANPPLPPGASEALGIPDRRQPEPQPAPGS